MIKTLTLNEIVNSLQSLNKLGDNSTLDFKLSYRLAKISKQLEPIVETYNKARNKFINDNGVVNKETGQTEIPATDKETIAKFVEVNDELMKETHDIKLELIPSDMFEKTSVSPNELRPILWAIVD